jgi:hypothetical protein
MVEKLFMDWISWRKLWRRSSNDYVVIPWSTFAPPTSSRRCCSALLGVWFINYSVYDFFYRFLLLSESRSEDYRAYLVFLLNRVRLIRLSRVRPTRLVRIGENWALWVLVLSSCFVGSWRKRRRLFGIVWRDGDPFFSCPVDRVERESVCHAVVDAPSCCYCVVVASSVVTRYPLVPLCVDLVRPVSRVKRCAFAQRRGVPSLCESWCEEECLHAS